MQAVQFTGHGGREVITYGPASERSVGPGDVRVEEIGRAHV